MIYNQIIADKDKISYFYMTTLKKFE